MIPEPKLLPPEAPQPLLRCCLCQRPPREILELPYGLVCPNCLTDSVLHHPLDDTAALLCAPILENTL